MILLKKYKKGIQLFEFIINGGYVFSLFLASAGLRTNPDGLFKLLPLPNRRTKKCLWFTSNTKDNANALSDVDGFDSSWVYTLCFFRYGGVGTPSSTTLMLNILPF